MKATNNCLIRVHIVRSSEQSLAPPEATKENSCRLAVMQADNDYEDQDTFAGNPIRKHAHVRTMTMEFPSDAIPFVASLV